MRRTLMAALAALTITGTFVVGATSAAGGAAKDDPNKDLREAITQSQKASKNFTQIMGVPGDEKKIPKELLADAECLAVFPDVVKAAFIFGGTGGKGVVSCRDPQTGRWGPPLFLKVGGASWGAQIGAQSADFVLVGVNRASQDVFTKGEWTLGADAAAVAGPVGRKASAATDWKLNGQLLSYSRSKGLFAGVSLEGAKIKIDEDVNRAVYGDATPADILMGHAKANPGAASVMGFPKTIARYGAAKPDRGGK
jgi:lipid-binding SYLF domain-containing protein